MHRKVELSGVVIGMDGKPAGDAVVMLQGQSATRFNSVPEAIRADGQGRFKRLVPTDHYYVIRAAKGAAASPVSANVVNAEAVRDLRLNLAPATRLFGRFESSEKTTPGTPRLQLSLMGPKYEDLPLEQQTLKGRLFGMPMSFHVFAETDKDGNYETWVGMGRYVYTVDPYERKEIVVDVSGQAEIKQDFPARARPERLQLEGKVVLEGDPTKPVGKATVKGHMPMIRTRPGRHLSVSGTPVTGEDGKFVLSRDVGDGVVEARTHDGKLAGTATFKDRQKSVVVRVGPAVTVKGRVLDSAGKPMPKFEIQWSRIVERFMSGGVFSGREWTNEKGEFEIHGLIPGQEYNILGTFKKGDDNQLPSYRRLIEFTPAVPGVFDAGDLKMP